MSKSCLKYRTLSNSYHPFNTAQNYRAASSDGQKLFNISFSCKLAGKTNVNTGDVTIKINKIKPDCFGKEK